jgi:hypothetical protein
MGVHTASKQLLSNEGWVLVDMPALPKHGKQSKTTKILHDYHAVLVSTLS